MNPFMLNPKIHVPMRGLLLYFTIISGGQKDWICRVFQKKHVYSINTWEYLSFTRVLDKKQCTRKLRLKRKSYFSYQNRVFNLRWICRLDGTLGALYPSCSPLLSATTCSHTFSQSNFEMSKSWHTQDRQKRFQVDTMSKID